MSASNRSLLAAAGIALACGVFAIAGCGTQPSAAPSGGVWSGAEAPDFSGIWLGTLDLGAVKLRVVYNITRTVDGGYTATSDSPDQGAFGLAVTRVETDGARIRIVQDNLSAVYSGVMAADGASIAGTFAQRGTTLAVVLARQAAPLATTRPQDPAAPYPYRTLDVVFPGGGGAVLLAGTLVWPQGDGPFKAVVLVSGSGPQNRNEELMNHRPFLVLADALARAGIASLRYDDRGIGASKGDFAAATTLDFAADARAAAAYLRGQTNFRTGLIGIAGHSEGGLIAPIAAEGNPDIGFIVLLAGPGVAGEQILLTQTRAISAASGVPAAQIDQVEAINGRIYEIVRTTPDNAEAKRRLTDILLGAGLPRDQLDAQIDQLISPWMRTFLTHDPIPVLRRLSIPVLALNGTLDLQVLSGVNLPPIQAAIRAAGNPKSAVGEMPGLNHLFQHATTGLMAEYAQIEETMSPEVLSIIAEWIKGI